MKCNFPIVLDDKGKPKVILENAFDVWLKDKIITDSNGSETLEFKLAFNDDKREHIQNEDKVLCGGREFIIRTIEDDRENTFISSFYCEASWYDIANGEPLISFKHEKIKADKALELILSDSDWKVGTIETGLDIEIPLEFKEEVTKLQALRDIPLYFSGELDFDIKNKKVNLVKKVGKDTDVVVSFEKNSNKIKRTIDTKELVTRIYPYGEGNLGISKINNKKEYVENYEYYEKIGKGKVIRPLVKKDDRFGNPELLKQWAESLLVELSKPKTSYEIKCCLIGEVLNLGDRVTVIDKDMGINQSMRVVGRNVNMLYPEHSELQLEKLIKDLSDQLSNSSSNKVADVSSTVKSVVSEITMFNMLLNSRGEYGFNYWIKNGFEIDDKQGYSGTTCFKASTEPQYEYFLEQEVSVSNRHAYVLSAMVDMEKLEKKDKATIGFEVTLVYDDDTTDVQYISLI